MRKTSLIKALLISILIASPLMGFFEYAFNNEESQIRPVVVIVNAEIYPNIEESIERYLEDLHNEGHEVIFRLWDMDEQPSVEELREYLKENYEQNNIQGAVLIGEIPYAKCKLPAWLMMPTLEGPLEEYLMDLSSANFVKSDSNEIINIGGSIQYNIWVSRIWPNTSVSKNTYAKPALFKKSEAELINAYFKKNHEYRTCQSPQPDMRIVFDSMNELTNYLSLRFPRYVHSWMEWYDYLYKEGSADEFRDFIQENSAQTLTLISHSNPSIHTFRTAKGETLLTPHHIAKMTITQPFVVLIACSASDFSFEDSLGSAYLFSENSSALVIAGKSIPANASITKMLGNTEDNFGNAYINSDDPRKKIVIALQGMLETRTLLNNLAEHNYYELTKTAAYLAIQNAVIQTVYNYIINPLAKGQNFLGDPTLMAYKDMEWCFEADETEVDEDELADLAVDL